MKPIDCGMVGEAIPEVALGLAPEALTAGVEAHVRSCTSCREELALVRMLAGSRAEPGPGLVARIQRGISFERQAIHRPWWALTAAAVAALALGIGVASGDGLDVVAPAFAMEVEESWSWDARGGDLWAGGVLWDELSDDDLERLLDDLDQGGV